MRLPIPCGGTGLSAGLSAPLAPGGSTERVARPSIRIASDMGAGAPAYEVMDTNSATFARYLKIRANRHDSFYDRPAGGVDLCNVQVPVRKKG